MSAAEVDPAGMTDQELALARIETRERLSRLDREWRHPWRHEGYCLATVGHDGALLHEHLPYCVEWESARDIERRREAEAHTEFLRQRLTGS